MIWLLVAAATIAATDMVSAGQKIPEAEIDRAIENGRLIQAHDMIELARPARVPADTVRLLRLEGSLALAEGRDGDAFLAFAKAAERGSDDCLVREGQGIAALRLGRLHAARVALESAAAACPNRWRTWNALGVAHDRESDWISSAGAYERAARLAPGSPQVANNRGYSLILQHRFEEAIALLEPTVRAAPNDERARRNLDIARVAAGKGLAARGDMESRDQWAGRLNNAGYIAYLMGRNAEAQDYLRGAIAARSTPFKLAEHNADAAATEADQP